MIKHGLKIAMGAAVLLLWLRGRKAEASKSAINEGTPTDGTNWTGNSLFDRLAGTDLVSVTHPNAVGSTSADIGKVGTAELGLTPSWNGSM